MPSIPPTCPIAEIELMPEIDPDLCESFLDDDHKLCPRCSKDGPCCQIEWVHCDQCEDGYDGHDCGEDCCACACPEENLVCQVCYGKCGWWICGGNCDESGKHTANVPSIGD